jgi:hypothetical protein
MWWSLRGDKWQYNMAHTSCMLDKQGYTRAGTYTHTRTNAHSHTHPRAHTHAEKYVVLIAFPWQLVLRTRLIVTLYEHCLSCLKFKRVLMLTTVWLLCVYLSISRLVACLEGRL